VVIKREESSYVCKIVHPTKAANEQANKTNEQTSESILASLYRAGLVLSPVWKDVAVQLSHYDDAILGLDTNILSEAVISEHVLSSLYLVTADPYIYRPKWIFIIIPSAVVHELEQGANIRNEFGLLRWAGRRSFRALQEILDLDRNADLSGISLMIVGETDPILDARTELRALRRDMIRSNRGYVKASSGDMIIRTQYESFLRQISFHKGVFFLTADKSNSALADVEGLHSIYYRRPGIDSTKEIREPEIRCESAKSLRKQIPVGKLIYELAVEFGTIQLQWNHDSCTVMCDPKGETLDHWQFRELKLPEVGRLLNIYESQPLNVPLISAEKMCLQTMHSLFYSPDERIQTGRKR
jgi:hypothetical protein